jgi:tRNA dimethylallyltransferase
VVMTTARPGPSVAARPGPVVAVVGPTAAGKSALSLALAAELNGEVVNADSMQLYRGMDIGTAKLAESERAGVPHHVLDIWEVTEPASVATYQSLARAAIDDILARGKVPLLVGGSGLYIRAVLDEFEFPGTDPVLRQALEDELAEHGPAPLYARLVAADPGAAARILPTNGRRIVRALEIGLLTGEPFAAALPEPRPVYDAAQIGVDVDTAVLDARIADRVDAMWAAGFVDEVRTLRERGLEQGRTASRALGYQQILRLLATNDAAAAGDSAAAGDGADAGDSAAAGDGAEADARAETVRATRRFVRRQRSWFRRDARIGWLDAARPDALEQALQAVRGFTEQARSGAVR